MQPNSCPQVYEKMIWSKWECEQTYIISKSQLLFSPAFKKQTKTSEEISLEDSDAICFWKGFWKKKMFFPKNVSTFSLHLSFLTLKREGEVEEFGLTEREKIEGDFWELPEDAYMWSVFTAIQTLGEWAFLMRGTKALVLCSVSLQAHVHTVCGEGGSVILPMNSISYSLNHDFFFKSFLEEEKVY